VHRIGSARLSRDKLVRNLTSPNIRIRALTICNLYALQETLS
jgi:hypothetical protein